MYNKVTLVGRIGRNPETKNFESGSTVCSFSLATSESYKDKNGEWQEITQWHNVQTWGKLAESLSNRLGSGDVCVIEGQVVYRKYTDKEGNERTVTDIKADKVSRIQKNEKNEVRTPEPEDKKSAWE